MKIPKGVDINKLNSKTHMLELIRNLYSQKQTVQEWNRYTTEKLLIIEFKNKPSTSASSIEPNPYLLSMLMTAYLLAPARAR